jgi:hypothetical protein|tara:strand:- start:36 stop:512 length:477 start_codon:yes stop_codon:yes gene_type:complete
MKDNKGPKRRSPKRNTPTCKCQWCGTEYAPMQKTQRTCKKECWTKLMQSEKKQDPKWILKASLLNGIRRVVKSFNGVKGSSAIEYLGCDLDTFKSHIESLFTEGMDWSNHGMNGWHVDHIVPISSAESVEDVWRLNHYTNLQPLWAIDNLVKGSKTPT